MQDSVGGPSPELARGVALLCSLQRADGSVAGEVVWSPVITAQYVLTAYLIGQPIESQRQARFLRYFRQTQTADGGWGFHPESRGYVFVTAAGLCRPAAAGSLSRRPTLPPGPSLAARPRRGGVHPELGEVVGGHDEPLRLCGHPTGP